MSQFDVHKLQSGPGLVIDCQADLHRDLPTRFVVPLIAVENPEASEARLAPRFAIAGVSMVMATQFAGSIPQRALGPVVESLDTERHRVIGAIDALVTGI